MGEPVERDVEILKAEYVPDADSIAIVGKTKDGRGRHQIHSSCFDAIVDFPLMGDHYYSTELALQPL